MQIVVIGGGAAGFFAAISCKTHHPSYAVTVYEKSDKLLAKVKVSGGGRCNVTNACADTAGWVQAYPRGGRQLKKAFGQFCAADTVAWFESRGVSLKTEADGRMFPVTDRSQTIIDCLTKAAEQAGVVVHTRRPVTAIRKEGEVFLLTTGDQEIAADKVIVTTGGSPRLSGFQWLADLGHTIQPPVPSLFTFNMPSEPVRALMGTVAEATIAVEGAKLSENGPVLITHWGMSGPAVLKLSARGARHLHEVDYHFSVRINWAGERQEEAVRGQMAAHIQQGPKKQAGKKNPFGLTNRLWLFLLDKAGIAPETEWGMLPKKAKNRLVNTLTHDVYRVSGKTTFKEEFVTCGGVDLSEVDFRTMESRKIPGLYFAGEVLDIDGITGGFNFQAAWTTGYIAGKTGLSAR